MDKKEIRIQMRRENRAVTAEERRRLSDEIFAHVESLPAFRKARCVAVFCSLDDEPSTREALKRWHEQGIHIAVPRVEGDTMRFFDYDLAKMVAGAFGIEEPGENASLCDVRELDFIVVPGVAFTLAGDRMGRGRGYYDRYLSQAGFRATKVGICYPHQIVATLPTEEHDVRMDFVVTA